MTYGLLLPKTPGTKMQFCYAVYYASRKVVELEKATVMPRAGQAMTLLCHIVGEERLGWALVRAPLQTSSRPAGTSSVHGVLEQQLRPHSCASVGSQVGACSDCGIHHCCHSPSRPQRRFVVLGFVDEATPKHYYVT